MGLKDVLLKKGWAGRTISRNETAARLNPIVTRLAGLLNAYDAFVNDQELAAVQDGLDAQIRFLRMDIGKVSEAIFSSGGIAERSARGAAAVPAGLDALVSEEEAVFRLLGEETEIEHEMHTRAVLGAVAGNTQERIRLLKRLR